MKNPYQKFAILQSPILRKIKRRIALVGLFVIGLALFGMAVGCNAMSKTAQKMADEFGDSVHSGSVLVDIWQITPSDPTTNSAPTGKKVTIIGKIDSIPVVAKNGETVKDYAKYQKTETPAWYNSGNVTKEEVFICTGDNAKEVVAYAKEKIKEATKTASSPPAEPDTGKAE